MENRRNFAAHSRRTHTFFPHEETDRRRANEASCVHLPLSRVAAKTKQVKKEAYLNGWLTGTQRLK